MPELFANHLGTTLSAAIASTVRPVTFTVASAAGLPATGNFRLILGPPNGTNNEILLITAITGTSLTGSTVEGSAAQTWAIGTAATHVLTAGSISFIPWNGPNFGNTTVFLGDSIVAFGNATQSGPDQSYSYGWTAQAVFLSKGRIQQVNNAGTPGNTCAQMLARFATDVVAYAPAVVVIAGGTNDLPGSQFTSATLAPVIATLSSLLDAAQTAGITPILCGIPIRADAAIYKTNSLILNLAIKRLAALRKVVFVDLYAATVDVSTGGYISTYGQADNVHPTAKGARAIAQAFLAACVTGAGSVYSPSTVHLPTTNAETINLIANGCFVNAVSGWSGGFGTSPAPTVSEVTDASIVGNWMQAVFAPATAGGQNYAYTTTNITGVAGKKYWWVFRLQIAGLETNGGTISFSSGYSNGKQVAYGITCDLADATFAIEYLSPVGGTQMNPGFTIAPTTTAGNITVKMAQVGLYDLTALGY